VLEKAAKKHKYDLFFLTDVDVPWEKDDLRDRPNDRELTLKQFEENLIQYKKPYIKLTGSKEKRFQKAVNSISKYEKAKKLGLNSFDFIEIEEREIHIEKIEQQIHFLMSGIQSVQLEKPAKLNYGIQSLSKDEANYYATFFEEKKSQLRLKKFVPASGAASRMFKFLSEFLQDYKLGEESINAYINRKKAKNLSLFLIGLDKFPFYEDVIFQLKKTFPEYDSWGYDARGRGGEMIGDGGGGGDGGESNPSILAQNGKPNTGGGGGGGTYFNIGGNGGSGIVIIKYKFQA
jgi:hypothetical protein